MAQGTHQHRPRWPIQGSTAAVLRLVLRSLLHWVPPLALCGWALSCLAFAVPTSTIYDQNADWLDDHGSTVRLDQWRGTPVIIAMAYTECTRICNATLHRLEEAQALADKRNTKIDFIVVSFDPSVDNPLSWTYYRKQHRLEHRDNWHFLTGSAAATKRLANQLGIEFWFDENHVMHDLKILYINPDGQIKKYLDWDHQDVNDLFR